MHGRAKYKIMTGRPINHPTNRPTDGHEGSILVVVGNHKVAHMIDHHLIVVCNIIFGSLASL